MAEWVSEREKYDMRVINALQSINIANLQWVLHFIKISERWIEIYDVEVFFLSFFFLSRLRYVRYLCIHILYILTS